MLKEEVSNILSNTIWANNKLTKHIFKESKTNLSDSFLNSMKYISHLKSLQHDQHEVKTILPMNWFQVCKIYETIE